jgi:hypothetical protein
MTTSEQFGTERCADMARPGTWENLFGELAAHAGETGPVFHHKPLDWALRLSLSIRTVLDTTPPSGKAAVAGRKLLSQLWTSAVVTDWACLERSSGDVAGS